MSAINPEHDRPARPWTDRWEHDGGLWLVACAVTLTAATATVLRVLLP